MLEKQSTTSLEALPRRIPLSKAAKASGFSEPTLRRYFKQGFVAGWLIGNRTYLDEQSLLEFIQGSYRPRSAEVA